MYSGMVQVSNGWLTNIWNPSSKAVSVDGQILQVESYNICSELQLWIQGIEKKLKDERQFCSLEFRQLKVAYDKKEKYAFG